MRADQSVRKRIELENGVSSNEEAIDSLDKQLSESKATLSDSENKFDDISRKLATMESDASRGNTMAEGAEKKIKDIEEELRVVGANMQQLEIGEEKTMAREEASQVEDFCLGALLPLDGLLLAHLKLLQVRPHHPQLLLDVLDLLLSTLRSLIASGSICL